MTSLRKTFMYFLIVSIGIFLNGSLRAMDKPSFATDAACSAQQADQLNIKVKDENEADLDKTFNAIREMQVIAQRIADAEQKKDKNRLYYEDLSNFTVYNRTKKGLFLTLGEYSMSLYTPWGKLKTFNVVPVAHEKNNQRTIFNLFNEFKRNVKLSFLKNEGEKPSDQAHKSRFYRDNYDDKNEIDERDLDKYRETDTLIMTSNGPLSWYKVLSVNGKSLPTPQATVREPSMSKRRSLYTDWAERTQLPIIANISLPALKPYFNFANTPNCLQAWKACKQPSDKIQVFERALEVIAKEKNKETAKKQANALKILLEQQKFLDYIEQELLEKINKILNEK